MFGLLLVWKSELRQVVFLGSEEIPAMAYSGAASIGQENPMNLWSRWIIAVITAALFLLAPGPAFAQREHASFDDGWRFMRGDAAGAEEGQVGESLGATVGWTIRTAARATRRSVVRS